MTGRCDDDDTGAPIYVDPNFLATYVLGSEPDVKFFVMLRPKNTWVGITGARLEELAAQYPLVDVEREFSRPGGMADWCKIVPPLRRKMPGKRGFWRFVHSWLQKAQSTQELRLRVRWNVNVPYVAGTKCECGRVKQEGAALCAPCADDYVVYLKMSLTRARTKGE